MLWAGVGVCMPLNQVIAAVNAIISVGADTMKLYTVCMSCLSVMLMSTQGTSRAMIPIIGVLYGEKDYG